MLERLAIAMAAIVWAGTAPLPPHIRNYLLVEFLLTPVIFLSGSHYGTDSIEFLITFSFVTWLLFLAGANAVWAYLKRSPYKMAIAPFALDIALVMAFVAYLGLKKPLWADDWVNIAAGLLRTLLWLCVLFSVKHIRGIERRYVFPLALWWMLRSLWDFGLPLHAPAWTHLNWVAPWGTFVAIMLMMGLLARLNRPSPHPYPD